MVEMITYPRLSCGDGGDGGGGSGGSGNDGNSNSSGSSSCRWSVSPSQLHNRKFELGSMRSMMTSSNGNFFRVTGHWWGEFTGCRWIPTQRLVTRSFDLFFDLRLNKKVFKQSWGWWYETPSCPSWRHSNGKTNSWYGSQVAGGGFQRLMTTNDPPTSEHFHLTSYTCIINQIQISNEVNYN